MFPNIFPKLISQSNTTTSAGTCNAPVKLCNIYRWLQQFASPYLRFSYQHII